MSLVELKFPQVVENEQTHYGGSQKWFEQALRQDAGCASICAANIAAYYAANYPGLQALYHGDATRFEQTDFITLMDEMCGYMPPNPAIGIPFMTRFIASFDRYARDHGIVLQQESMKVQGEWRKGFAVVKQAIDHGNPVALLILRHSDPEFFEDTWHWVTISGYIDDAVKPKVIYSNFGGRDIRSADKLFDTNPDNILYIAYFHAEGDHCHATA